MLKKRTENEPKTKLAMLLKIKNGEKNEPEPVPVTEAMKMRPAISLP